jgi:hypothetical protein
MACYLEKSLGGAGRTERGCVFCGGGEGGGRVAFYSRKVYGQRRRGRRYVPMLIAPTTGGRLLSNTTASKVKNPARSSALPLPQLAKYNRTLSQSVYDWWLGLLNMLREELC